MTATRWTAVDTAIGTLTLVAGPEGVEAVHFPERAPALPAGAHDPEGLAEAAAQLRDLVEGRRQECDLPLHLTGTPLQMAVWRELRRIPYGETVTYRQLAARVGRPTAVRAVGAAVGATPTAILVPCHRAICSDGTLRGYAGGLDRKAALLATERAAAGSLDAARRPARLAPA